jgi:hypothetical protein
LLVLHRYNAAHALVKATGVVWGLHLNKTPGKRVLSI